MRQLKIACMFIITISFFTGCIVKLGENEIEVNSKPTQNNKIVSPTSTVEFSQTEASSSIPIQAGTSTVALIPSKSQELDFIREMYATNGGCELPCFWGIKPGQEVDSVLNRFSPYIGDYTGKDDDGFNIVINPPQDIDLFSRKEWKIYVRIQDNLVKTVAGDADYINSFADQDLRSLLSSLKSPDEIWVEIYTEMDPNPWYRIALFYQEKGIRVGWRGSLQDTTVSENRITGTICPRSIVNEIDMISYIPPYFVSWLPDEDLSFHEFNEKYAVIEPYYLLTDQNSDVDVENFYETYIDTDVNNCFTYTD